ncbi:kinase-like protein [Microstroma glucosiphilum]|uniref:non-specific serine/threonine protein kinase n=1 Tax=Pseudomicrostroma glucosiphilum TaxID=1684307 RepID=A0A316UI04_9BASI|nr:kinase-like protein [Pseudomicrostroma glucosiphilum]PWN23951.1 kinase-like protein [Pseudomicrostroma glucosiphilum]
MASFSSTRLPSHHHQPLIPPTNENDNSSSSSDEDGDVPLFNPSGLRASAHRSTKGTVFDPLSHAATRLGLSPPSQQGTGAQQPATIHERSSASTGSEQPEKRGRRRRSSEFAGVLCKATPLVSSLPASSSKVEGLPASSERSHQWWERRERPNGLSLDVDVAKESAPASTISGPDRSQSPSSATTRSQAAEFLSSFSSKNSSSTLHSRESSNHTPLPFGKQSQPGPGQSGDRSRAPSVQSINTDLSASWQGGSVSAAAGFLAHKGALTPSSSTILDTSQLRPDDEGYRFGPDRCYAVGKLVGFGGFSTIREGWDMSTEGSIARITGNEIGTRHKVAIKVSYHEPGATTGEELSIWRRLPAHPNLLPLLHDERVVVDKATQSVISPRASTGMTAMASSSEKHEVELLVMPFCDQGNLMSFIRSEGGKRVESSPASSISRRTSLKRSADATSASRGGSSFGPSSSSRADRVVSTGGAFSGPRSSSSVQRTLSHSSTGLQRALSFSTRSRGVSLKAARECTRQLAEGLFCLHNRAQVLHGDLKLENVLGQPKRSSQGFTGDKTAPRPSDIAEKEDAIEDSVCWRLADFGLSRRVVEDESQSSLHDKAASWLKDGPEESRARSKARSSGHITAGLAGGSIAYTPPERWQEGSLEGSTSSSPGQSRHVPSPFASDMWAIGCMVYALLSGKLPFNDAFEPRLQALIAKGDWDFPPRLWRRARRLLSDVPRSDNDQGHRSRSASHHSSGDHSHLASSLTFSPRDLPQRNHGVHFMEDLSASLPSLQATQRTGYAPLHHGTASAHEAPVVGSMPTKSGELNRFDIDVVAQAAADAEADAESDEDGEVDQDWDGTSADRAAAREVLRGLLAVDPTQRWTVEQLVRCKWLYDPSETDHINRFEPHQEAGDGTPNKSRRQLHDVHEEVAWGDAEVPTRPQWGRQRSWRNELSFEKMDHTAVQRRQRRDSSLTRSRPASRQGVEEGTGSSSRGVSRHRGSIDRDAEDADADASIVYRSGTGSPALPPASPIENRGRRPRAIARFEQESDNRWTSTTPSVASSRSRPIAIASPSHPSSRSQSLNRITSRSMAALSRAEQRAGEDDDLFGFVRQRSHSRPPLLSRPSNDAVSSTRGSENRSTSSSRGRSGPFTSDRSSPALVESTNTNTTRSSTSRSRSRAPDALAQALRRSGRSSSRPRASPMEDDDGGVMVGGVVDQADAERVRGRRGRRD